MPVRAKSVQTTFSTNITKSARQAQGAIRSSLKELTPQSQERVKSRGLTNTSAKLSGSLDRGVAALASVPRITFGVTKQGNLTFEGSTKGIARHEVAHFAAGAPSARQHLTFKAAGTQGSAAGLKRTEGVQMLPVKTQIAMAMKRCTLVRVSSSSQSRVGGNGFQTNQLKKTAGEGFSSQSDTARTQMRKLGARLKGKVDF